MRLTDLMFFVKDLPRMAAFYTDVMKLRPIEETRVDTWVQFDTGAARFALHQIPLEIAQQIEIADPPKPREQGAAKVTFAVDDLQAERVRLEAAGVRIVDRPWGGWDVVDPEGNLVHIAQSGL